MNAGVSATVPRQNESSLEEGNGSSWVTFENGYDDSSRNIDWKTIGEALDHINDDMPLL